MTPGFDVENVLAELSIEEKAGLTSGANFWELKAVERLGVPRIILTDGPHGLRLQAGDAGDLTQSKNRPATCFPTATTLGSTWDPELVRRVGMALGRETRAAGVSVILGPGLNIKRHPLCGRNFEYIAEDPVISGHIGAALVQGIQSEGVGASPKHFACNSQETDRMRISAEVDERTLREIYFPAFEYVVRQAQPWTVMSAYNRVNGVFASENRWLLVEVLRDEWGFDGLVVSDWGAVGERPVSLAAGIDLEMPGTRGVSDAYLVREIAAGRAAEAALNQATARVLRLISRGLPALNDPGEPNHAAHHRLAREVAAAGTVLLRNEPVGAAPLLPLASGTKVAVIGEFARTPRYQGAGSSMVNPTRLESLLDGLAELGETVAFAPGYTLELDDGGTSDEVTLRDEAVAAARQAEVAVVFVGLPLEREAEGRDRDDISLPAAQVALVEAVAAAQPRTVVVVAGGSVVELPWRTQVPAIMEMWLAGQAGGPALADLLYGHQVPGGRLAETIPLRLQHTPAYGNFPGEGGKVRYGEGVLVGYRWYDYRDIPVAYPFGHGLTYTTFDYSDAVATVSGDGDNTEVSVTVNVSNTGTRRAPEVVQLYVADPDAAVLRPVRELKAFQKVWLNPGESRRVRFTLTARDLSYWHPGLKRWALEPGQFGIDIGASSRDIRISLPVTISAPPLPSLLDDASTVDEWLAHPTLRRAMLDLVGAGESLADSTIDPVLVTLMGGFPARLLSSLGIANIRKPDLDALLAKAAEQR